MSATLETVQALAARGEVLVSAHGYEELTADRITTRDAVEGLVTAAVVEDYPTFPKGPAVLVLEHDLAGQPIHVVWGIPQGQSTPAVLVTAYRPDPAQWDESWLKRRT